MSSIIIIYTNDTTVENFKDCENDNEWVKPQSYSRSILETKNSKSVTLFDKGKIVKGTDFHPSNVRTFKRSE